MTGRPHDRLIEGERKKLEPYRVDVDFARIERARRQFHLPDAFAVDRGPTEFRLWAVVTDQVLHAVRSRDPKSIPLRSTA